MEQNLLSSLEEAVVKYEKGKGIFNTGPLEKIRKYPLRIVFSKFLDKAFQLRYVVKNRLFTGDSFFTEGYYMDFYLCGLLSADPEIRLAKYLIKNLNKDDIFFDIGANYGYYTVIASRLGARAHSFEPTSSVFEILSKNCPNAILNNAAVGAFDGEADFLSLDSGKEHNGLLVSIGKEEKSSKHEIKKVRVVTLDCYCEKIFPTLMKVDVEGGENDVIKGASLTLSHKPKIVMEFLPEETYFKAVDVLLEMGYSLYAIDKDGNEVPETISRLKNRKESDNILFK